MIRNWHTGHSVAVGAFVGMLLDQHVWTLCGFCFLAGLAAGRGWSLIDAGVRRLRRTAGAA